MKLKLLVILLGIVVVAIAMATSLWRSPAQPQNYPGIDGANVVFKVGEMAKFLDGLEVTLTAINDSRCKPDVQCIWQGELAPELTVSGGNFFKSSRTIRLGTVNNQTITESGYVFALQSATETTATITVNLVKIEQTTNNSGISGYVHVGPTCPVERMPPDPMPTGRQANCVDKPFSVTIQIYSPDMSLQKSVTSDAAGHFEISLPVGEYVLRPPQGTNIGSHCVVETRVTVNKDAVTNVDIACDSGIR